MCYCCFLVISILVFLSDIWLFCNPMNSRLLYPWDFSGKNTGVGCHSLLQGIFLIQGSNLGLMHCRQILYCLSCQGNLCMYNWIVLLYTWNWLNSVDKLYSNTKQKVKKNQRKTKKKQLLEFFLHSTEDKPYTEILQSLALELNLYKIPALVFLSFYLYLVVYEP